jgi:hypothetical protein
MTKIATKDLVVKDEALGIERNVLAGQPIPPDLEKAYIEAGGDSDDVPANQSLRFRLDGSDEPLPIAVRDMVVHDDNIGIDRQIKGGQAVPPDLIDAYNAEIGNAPASDQGEPVDYDSQQVDDLQAEADRRGLEVEGTGADGNVLKKDLVAALKADDAA